MQSLELVAAERLLVDIRCSMCNKALPKGRRRYCSEKCSNRASWVAKYGLSPEDYRILLGDGTCPICGRKMRRVNVDHNHKTNEVRGLVCGTCNKRVLTAISQPMQAFRLLLYLLDNPGKMWLDGKPRTVGAAISTRDKGKRRYNGNY